MGGRAHEGGPWGNVLADLWGSSDSLDFITEIGGCGKRCWKFEERRNKIIMYETERLYERGSNNC